MSFKWKLEQNAKLLSKAQEFSRCTPEWIILSDLIPINELGADRCLCSNKNLKYGYIIYNTITREFAVVGRSCVKKFGIKKGKIKKNSIFSLIINPAIYTDDFDPKEASIIIRQTIFDKFECEIEKADELDRLNVILVEIEWDIENYQFSFLKSLQERLIAKINDIQTMLDERERQRILEQKRQDKIQAERKRKLILEQERQNKIQAERERKENLLKEQNNCGRFRKTMDNTTNLTQLNDMLLCIEKKIINEKYNFYTELINDLKVNIVILTQAEKVRMIRLEKEQKEKERLQYGDERREVEELMREDPSLPRKDAEAIVFLRTINF